MTDSTAAIADPAAEPPATSKPEAAVDKKVLKPVPKPDEDELKKQIEVRARAQALAAAPLCLADYALFLCVLLCKCALPGARARSLSLSFLSPSDLCLHRGGPRAPLADAGVE